MIFIWSGSLPLKVRNFTGKIVFWVFWQELYPVVFKRDLTAGCKSILTAKMHTNQDFLMSNKQPIFSELHIFTKFVCSTRNFLPLQNTDPEKFSRWKLSFFLRINNFSGKNIPLALMLNKKKTGIFPINDIVINGDAN